MLNETVAPSSVHTPVYGENMVKNNTGGYVYEITPLNALRRFLIMGAEKDSFYESKGKIFHRVLSTLDKILATSDYASAINSIVDVSVNNLAPKNNAAIFALAMAASFKGVNSAAVRSAALNHVSEVCRTPTELFEFVEYTRMRRGFGPGLRRAISNWYLSRGKNLGYQLVKYRNRNDWSHRDMLRLAHVRSEDPQTNAFFAFVCNEYKGELNLDSHSVTTERRLRKGSAQDPVVRENVSFNTESDFRIVEGYMRARTATSSKEMVRLIDEYRLVQELIPSEFLSDKDVQMALLRHMPITAALRNVGRYTSTGVVAPFSEGTELIVSKLSNPNNFSKMHPVNLLSLQRIYSRGYSGGKSNITWTPVTKITDALESAFYNSFQNIVPTGKRYMLGIDISGSMDNQSPSFGLTYREIAMAMAMATVRTEANCEAYALTNQTITPLNIQKNETINSLVSRTNRMNFGGTGLSQVFDYAEKRKIVGDVFCLYTDNEVNDGGHPSVHFNSYRKKMNPEVRMIVNAFAVTNLSVANPNDPYQLDIPGFGSDTPAIISAFSRGVF
jgi:60 kDa SS-A/Ro ribonucleoprotein